MGRGTLLTVSSSNSHASQTHDLQSTENVIKIGNEVNVKEMFGLMEKPLN